MPWSSSAARVLPCGSGVPQSQPDWLVETAAPAGAAMSRNRTAVREERARMPAQTLLRAKSGASTRMGYRGLSRGHPRDGHAVRRAAHVVEPRHVEEVDRVRVPAVLAADAELQVGLVLASDPRREAHEPADAGLVDRLERAAVDDLL